jgi:hypothetical protein
MKNIFGKWKSTDCGTYKRAWNAKVNVEVVLGKYKL